MNPTLDSKFLSLLYIWLSMAAHKMLPKDFLLNNGKYQFQQLRSYQWKLSTDPDSAYASLPTAEEPYTFTFDDHPATFWGETIDGIYNPSGIDTTVNYECWESGGSSNMDFQINYMTTEQKVYDFTCAGLTFNILLSCTLQYKKTTDVSWTDCTSINDMYKLCFGAENHTAEISDDSNTSGNGTQYFMFFQLPDDEGFDHYQITGIEWKNGDSTTSTVFNGIVLLDGIPPTSSYCPPIVLGMPTTVAKLAIITATLINNTLLGCRNTYPSNLS